MAKDWIVIAVKPLVVDRKHIFRPLAGPHGVSHVLDVEKFGRVGAAERSVIDRMGTVKTLSLWALNSLGQTRSHGLVLPLVGKGEYKFRRTQCETS